MVFSKKYFLFSEFQKYGFSDRGNFASQTGQLKPCSVKYDTSL